MGNDLEINAMKVEKTVFVTADGSEFYTLPEAAKHAKKLKNAAYLRKLQMDVHEFTVTEQHIKAIQEMSFVWTATSDLPDCKLDGNRPFGNSDIYVDIADILGIGVDDEEYGDYSDEDIDKIEFFFLDLRTVLEILTQTCNLMVGTYRRDSWMDKWGYIPRV